MIERVIENWLINSNERGFEIPFVQCLLNEGHTILLTPSHGPFEQGKDIVTIGPNGEAYAYQLKSGDIDLDEWREIRGEVIELVEMPIKYPKPIKKKHKSYLVTNGDLSPPARQTIIDQNKIWVDNDFEPLEIICKDELLGIFLDNTGDFLPSEINDFSFFLDLYVQTEKGILDKNKYVRFLEDFIRKDFRFKIEIKRTLSSLVMLCQYILGSFERKKDHIKLVESWTIFMNNLLYIVERENLDDVYWYDTFNLIMDKILSQLEELKKEVIERENYLESDWDGGKIISARLTIIGGWLSALELMNKKLVKDYEVDKNVCEFVINNLPYMWYWGEYANPYYIMMVKLLQITDNSPFGLKILNDVLARYVLNNNKADCAGMPDPYVGPSLSLENYFGVADDPIDFKQYIGASYHLSSIISYLVKNEQRAPLEALWKEISYILNQRLIPEKPEDYLLYRIERGDFLSNYFSQPQSYNELLRQATNPIADYIPKVLKNYDFYIYLLLLVYPHRLDQEIIKLL